MAGEPRTAMRIIAVSSQNGGLRFYFCNGIVRDMNEERQRMEEEEKEKERNDLDQGAAEEAEGTIADEAVKEADGTQAESLTAIKEAYEAKLTEIEKRAKEEAEKQAKAIAERDAFIADLIGGQKDEGPGEGPIAELIRKNKERKEK